MCGKYYWNGAIVIISCSRTKSDLGTCTYMYSISVGVLRYSHGLVSGPIKLLKDIWGFYISAFPGNILLGSHKCS